jgi:hypothetical protein
MPGSVWRTVARAVVVGLRLMRWAAWVSGSWMPALATEVPGGMPGASAEVAGDGR